MNNLQEILTEVSRFKTRRAELAQGLKFVDERYKKNLLTLEQEHASKLKALDAECQSGLAAIESRARESVADYIRMKNSLQQYMAPVKQWCPPDAVSFYTPNPARVNETELSQLLHMLQEQGFMAWIKRTFKLGGYSSRAEMATELCRKIEDACAYCDERISQIQSGAENERSAQLTQTRRKIAAEKDRFLTAKRQLELRQKEEKEKALVSIGNFDSSAQLQGMHTRIKKMQVEAESFCGVWGEYSAPTQMPEQVLLCNGKVSLPNEHGIDKPMALPLWINLFETNIIVLTAAHTSVADTSSREKEFVRRFLAQMLKTVPTGNCSYSIFDNLHKGGSLERLIDVTNMGTTDLHFDLFTSNESDAAVVSCAERRKYLRNRPAEIIKYIAGRSKSLFAYNKETGDFEFPFTWYIDFNFPSTPDKKYLDDLKELFVNAPAAGYSFLFVTTPEGLGQIRELAQHYAGTQVIHIDVDQSLCTQGSVQVEYLETDAPKSDQIYNFMTAMKKYYEDGGSIDNRIDTIFTSNAIALRDASKKISIPMAIDSRGRLIDLELGGEGSVHGFISGDTNSGKSTLLHTIILSACLHYHPSDLEIWLVDYKQTEFHLYKKKTPPHIKLIGVSKTADFTFSLLEKIEAEADRRTQLMNLFDVQNLEDYRKHKGEPGYEHFPRLFIIIDEFHEMSQFVSSEITYKEKLENILRECRAQGITCLLADQTFSTGLSGLTPAAKNQIGLRIAMKNKSTQEIKDTLEVDRALYSVSMQRTISIMSQGEFIMKVYIRNASGELTDIKLEKFKGLHTKGDDILPISMALRIQYKGQYSPSVLYVNTKEQAVWNTHEPAALDQAEPLRYPNIRLYLGRSATLRPCFGLDIGRQPDENVSIVGGTAFQRWELIASILRSCILRSYKVIVFMAEYSDLYTDHGHDLRALCATVPGAEICETTEQWCSKLVQLEQIIDSRQNAGDILCLFVGLEVANVEFSRLPARGSSGGGTGSFLEKMRKHTATGSDGGAAAAAVPDTTFNVMPIIDKLFSNGARNGIRCITEISVFRQFSKILKIRDMCRHKIAFRMSADDCLMYLGNSSFQKSIGQNAVYCDGGKEVKKLIPYQIQ